MAHSPLATILQESFAKAANEMEKDIDNGQAGLPDGYFSLNPFLPQKTKKGQNLYNTKEINRSAKIVIVGAGLAGLTTAYRLKKAGIIATIYEASDRVGGRCWTRRGFFKDGQIVERGGEFIDSGHWEIQELAKELGLVLDHLINAEPVGTKPIYFFNGVPYTFEELIEDFKQIYSKLQKDLKEVGEMTFYDSYTERGYELDHLSIVDYINEIVPGGSKTRFGQLLEIAYTAENGADAHKQSALNLLYLLGDAKVNKFHIYGDSDECYHIKGGNDQLPALLAKQLEGQIMFHSQLVKIEQKPKEIRLVFRNYEEEWEVCADKVVLAIPFRILRMLDYKNAGFCPIKEKAIEELGMGVNTKLHAQFVNRFWNEAGNNGETFADTGYQQTFDSSRAQKGDSGILVNYTGGETAAKQVVITEEQVKRFTEKFLDKLEPVYPGCKRKWNGLATVDNWLSNKWTQGSYSYWKIGQYTKFAGILGEREGNIFFAGEHTSIKFPGYLNGAVESGNEAAEEVMNDLIN